MNNNNNRNNNRNSQQQQSMTIINHNIYMVQYEMHDEQYQNGQQQYQVINVQQQLLLNENSLINSINKNQNNLKIQKQQILLKIQQTKRKLKQIKQLNNNSQINLSVKCQINLLSCNLRMKQQMINKLLQQKLIMQSIINQNKRQWYQNNVNVNNNKLLKKVEQLKNYIKNIKNNIYYMQKQQIYLQLYMNMMHQKIYKSKINNNNKENISCNQIYNAKQQLRVVQYKLKKTLIKYQLEIEKLQKRVTEQFQLLKNKKSMIKVLIRNNNHHQTIQKYKNKLNPIQKISSCKNLKLIKYQILLGNKQIINDCIYKIDNFKKIKQDLDSFLLIQKSNNIGFQCSYGQYKGIVHSQIQQLSYGQNLEKVLVRQIDRIIVYSDIRIRGIVLKLKNKSLKIIGQKSDKYRKQEIDLKNKRILLIGSYWLDNSLICLNLIYKNKQRSSLLLEVRTQRSLQEKKSSLY